MFCCIFLCSKTKIYFYLLKKTSSQIWFLKNKASSFKFPQSLWKFFMPILRKLILRLWRWNIRYTYIYTSIIPPIPLPIMYMLLRLIRKKFEFSLQNFLQSSGQCNGWIFLLVENLTLVLNKLRHLLTNVRFSTSFWRKLKIACLFKSDWDSTYVSKTKFLPVLWFWTLESTSCYVRKSCEKM